MLEINLNGSPETQVNREMNPLTILRTMERKVMKLVDELNTYKVTNDKNNEEELRIINAIPLYISNNERFICIQKSFP